MIGEITHPCRDYNPFLEESNTLPVEIQERNWRLKCFIKDFFALDITVPGLQLGERLIQRGGRHVVDLERNSIDLVLNPNILYLGTDTLLSIEEAIQGISEDKEWSLKYMVVVPRVYFRGFTGGNDLDAAFMLRVYLELDPD